MECLVENLCLLHVPFLDLDHIQHTCEALDLASRKSRLSLAEAGLLPPHTERHAFLAQDDPRSARNG